MSASILVVDDEPDVAELFRQRFRRETRQGTCVMHVAASGMETLDRIGRVTVGADGTPIRTDAYAATVQGHGGGRLAFANAAALVARHATPDGLVGFVETASLIH
jgi:CheY-like chemotaxis protein